MKLYTRTLSLACLAVFAMLFAVSTPAQDAAQVFNKLKSLHTSSSGGDASAASKSPHKSAASANYTETCTYPFTSGSGFTYMNYCVTVNGTLANFESPAGVEMLDQFGSYEGYGICDATTNVAYWDYNYGDSGNWNAPVKVTDTATEVKITRTTSDGAWLLTQTITKVSGTTPAAKIAMALKNTSGETKNVMLVRFAEMDPANAASTFDFAENYDGSEDSAWGYIPYFATFFPVNAPSYGLMLQNYGEPTPASTFAISYGYAYNSGIGPNPCNPLAEDTDGDPTSPGLQVGNGNAAANYVYLLELNKNQTSTATLRYFSF